jgi:hypothetical protein
VALLPLLLILFASIGVLQLENAPNSKILSPEDALLCLKSSDIKWSRGTAEIRRCPGHILTASVPSLCTGI